MLQQIKIKISHLQNELKIEEPKAKKAGKENQTLMNELDSTTKVLELIEQEISNCKFDANEEVQLVEKLSRLKLELESIEKQIENSERSLRGFEFHYTDPIPNFNRKKVKGLVANLISISKEHLDKADALEVCAGGKLYQVVVEDETTASQLIQKGNLRRRVTIIPLNKISATPIKPEKLAAAQKLAPNEVFLALSLIGSEPELEKAMSHVFGTSLVCKSHATAKKITFDKSVMLRSVTLDGDMYDPSGQLTGGAKSQSAGSLIKLQELNSLRNSKSQKLKEVKAVQSKLDELLENKNLLASLQQKQNLKKHELSLLQHRMENNPHCKVILNVEQMLKEHALLKQDLIDQTAKLKQLNQQVAEIEREMNEFSSNRDSKLKELRKKIADGKQLLANLEPTVAKMKESQLLAKEEISRAEMDIKTIEEKLAENENTLKVIETEEGDLKNTLKSLNVFLPNQVPT